MNNLEREQQLANYKFLTIPESRKNDLFYLKLGYQCGSLAKSNYNYRVTRSVYSDSYGIFSLNALEVERLHNAAQRAEINGELSEAGYFIEREKPRRLAAYGRIHYLDRYPHRLEVRSDIKFISMISSNDPVRNS